MSRNYSSTAVDTTLTTGVSAAATTIPVGATTGFPAAPFVLALSAGSAAQELVLVTAVGGLNLTVTRGYDSTVAATHGTGAVVRHSHAAIDFREAGTHIDATAAHGATGAVVGTTNAQTLTNKTLTDPVINESTRRLGHYQAYVPTLTNFTATITYARYTTIGKHVIVQGKLALTGAPTGQLGVGLPINSAASHPTDQSGPVGTAFAHDVAVASAPGVVLMDSATAVLFASSHVANAFWNATIPFTWGAGDEIGFHFEYEGV